MHCAPAVGFSFSRHIYNFHKTKEIAQLLE